MVSQAKNTKGVSRLRLQAQNIQAILLLVKYVRTQVLCLLKVKTTESHQMLASFIA